jgi:hypothetical protein
MAKRARTNTPLQALNLLNDKAYAEMAMGLATRVLRDQRRASFREHVAYAARLCLARSPNEREIEILLGAYESELARFEADPGLAQALVEGLDPQAWQPPPDVSVVQLAAWFHVAHVLLNLDETITKG